MTSECIHTDQIFFHQWFKELKINKYFVITSFIWFVFVSPNWSHPGNDIPSYDKVFIVGTNVSYYFFSKFICGI